MATLDAPGGMVKVNRQHYSKPRGWMCLRKSYESAAAAAAERVGSEIRADFFIGRQVIHTSWSCIGG